jgi:NADPH:quinone reductase-like Zn-dependent oxidoreductase/acyl carrier protein/SAM-dependent methyltransferase
MTKDGAPCEAFENLRRRCANEVDKGTLYKEFYKRGLEYGNDFQTIERLWLGDDAAFSVINASKHLAAEHDNYIIHPVIMDAGFQTLASIKSEGTYLPVRFGKINVYSKPLSTVWCYSRLDDITDDGIEGTVSLFDDKGKLIAEINNLYCRKMQEYGRSSQENIYRHLYEYKWIQDAHFANNCSKKMKNKFPSNINMFSKLKAETEELVVNHQRERYYQIVEPAFDRLCTQYITEAFEKLGLNFIKGSIFSSVGLAERLGVSDEHHKVFERFLNILEEDGILKKGKESWLVLNQPAKEDHNILWNEILKREPEYQCELQLLNGCASRLSEILKGEEDPLSFIFSNSSLSIEQFYKSSSTMKVYNVLLSKVMKSIVEGIPKEKTLRILEVGAGTGSLTSYVLPLLPPYRTEYSFTDISGLFTIQAEKRFSDYEFIEYKTLDIEKDPINQGFEPNVFDIVLASDAIHATSHLTDTIENIKKLLAPGGMLIFIEQAKVTRWFDLVFGLLKGWWLFSDHDIRPHYPLMQMSSWERLLRESGFKDISFMPEKELGHIPQHSLIIARGAEDIEALRTEASSREDLKTRKWIVFADDKGVAERFGSTLEKKGIKHIFVLKGDKLSIEDPLYLVIQQDQPEHYGIVLDFLCRDSNSTPVVINMWSLMNSQNKFDMSLTQAESKEPSIYSCIDTSVHILYLMQALIKNIWQETPHLWIITKGLHAVGEGKTVEVTEAPVWGLGRVMISENQNIITRLVDLSPVIGDHELEMLVTQLLFPSDEDEMVLRGDCLYVHRLTRKNQNELLCKPDVPYVLKMCKDKAFKELEFVQASRKSPLKGEVEVRIHAAGVNFKDVVRQSGLLEDNILVNKDSSGELGQECSGTVIAVGEGVEQFKVGDKVMGLAFNSFARYATLDERILVKVPENISFEGAATIPLVFLSSYYALNRLAGIKRGERVLIHTAASGVGLSAIQIALAAGAEVLATAGTPEKRDFLKAMGIKFVADSRSLEFADEIMNYTGNEGVDIILNTLPEKTIETSMSVLKPITGRFIDISNIYSNSIRLYSPHKGITFHSFDLNSMVRKHPQNAREMLDEIAEKLNAGIYSPIPYWTFPVSETANALITMKKGLHIGKIVISMGEDVVTRPSKKIQVTEDGTYLITGGLGGFGLAAAEWLVQCGARNLVLVGRKGASTPHAREVIGKLIKNGVKIGVECADITREESVKEIFSKIENEMPSLKGVIHAAMVLEDAFLTDMNETKMSKVMEPKILGGWNLHVNTLDKKLDFFICFSSFASMVGNSDQGNYVAANVFLESLATLRQSMNLPALTVCWGPLGDVGYVSQRDEIKEHFKRQGFREISIGQAWETISIALDNNLTTVGIAPVDWKTAARYNNSIDRSPRYSKLVGKSQDSSKIDEKHISNIKITSQMQSHERKQMFTEVLSSEVATILGVPVSKLDANLPFSALGFDSLMAVELVVRIEETVGIKLPKMTLMRAGLNIYELVDIVEKEIENKRGIITKEGKAIENRTEGIEEKGKSIEAAEEKEGVEKNMESSALGKEDMPANVDELTDEEVEELLSRMLLKGDEKGEKK